MIKICKRCKESWPIEDFRQYIDNRGYGPYRFHVCRDCERIKNRDRNKKYQNTDRSRYRVLKQNSKIRGFKDPLSFEEYCLVFKNGKICSYCQNPLPVVGSGIDRMDNSIGSVFKNCIPCCTFCNKIKSNCLTHEEMKAVAETLRKIR